MTDKTQAPIPTAAAAFRDLLVEAAQACQAAPGVERQEAEAEAELVALDRLLTASDKAMKKAIRFANSNKNIASYKKALGEAGDAREQAAALAEVEGNKRLAKACRAVAAAIRLADSLLSKPDPEQTRREQLLLLEKVKAETKVAHQKALALLKSCRAHAHARAAHARRQRAEIDAWKKRETDLRASCHALAALARIPGTARAV